MTNPIEPLTRAQAVALCAIDTAICPPYGCHEDDLEPCSGDVEGWWQCGKCGSALTAQVAQAFIEEPLSFVNQTIQYMHAGTTVLHVQAMITGRIARVHKPNEYRDKDGNAIDQHVVEFEDGNAFILSTDERVLVPLTAHQVQVLEQLSMDMRTLIIGAVSVLRRPGSRMTDTDEHMQTVVLLLRAALTQQLRALGT